MHGCNGCNGCEGFQCCVWHEGCGDEWCEGRRAQVNAVKALRILKVNGGQSDNGVMGSNHLTCIRVLIASPILDNVHVNFRSDLHLDTHIREPAIEGPGYGALVHCEAKKCGIFGELCKICRCRQSYVTGACSIRIGSVHRVSRVRRHRESSAR